MYCFDISFQIYLSVNVILPKVSESFPDYIAISLLIETYSYIIFN